MWWAWARGVTMSSGRFFDRFGLRSPDLVSIGYAVDSYIATYLEPKMPGSLSDTEKEVLRARLVFFLQRYYGVEREKFSRS